MSTEQTDTARVDLKIPAIFALAKVIFHLASTGKYGIFRDEFYYLDCANHLDWGYVDHPPLSIFILWVFRGLLGDSMLAIRFPTMLIGAATIFITGMMVRDMGGKRWAQTLACLAVFIAPIYMVMGSFFSMNPFDQFFWTLGAYVLVRIIQEDNPKLWLYFGLVAGLGLQNKISVAFFGIGLVVALLLTPQRKHYRDKHLHLGGAIAVLIFLPHLIWQITHDWATLEFMRNATLNKNVKMPPLDFMKEQLLLLHPFTAPLWITGLVYAFVSTHGRRFRLLALIFLTVLVVFLSTSAKAYYLAPAFPMIFALGAVAFERGLHGTSGWRKVSMPLYTGILIVGGGLLAPYAVPLLPPADFLRYQETIGITAAPAEVGHERTPMPQHLADRFGWPEMAQMVIQAYKALPPAEQVLCEIMVNNYGEAGAINFYGASEGLPQVLCGHNNYFYWADTDAKGEVVLILSYSGEELKNSFESVEALGVTNHPFAMAFENGLTLYLCRGLKVPFDPIWQGKKYFG